MSVGLDVKVEVDQRTNTKTLIFNRSVSSSEGSSFLWGNPTNAALLKPIGSSAAGKAQIFLLDTRDLATIMSLRPQVRQAIIDGSLLRSNAKPYDFPQWVPGNIQNDIKSGKLPKGVTRYPGSAEWGSVVVWTGNATVQIYQEFPSSLAFYSGIAKDDFQARLLHSAYTQYNKDMQFWVQAKGLAPEDAKSEIRRTNDEVFKLIIEGAVAILTSGVGISQVNSAMRLNAEEVSNAARRSPRVFVQGSSAKIRPVGGCVNVGGGSETPQFTNLNPLTSGTSGGPDKGIPNLVKGKMEEMDQLFEAGSVEQMISNKLRFVDVNWDVAARAAARAMRPGGKVGMNVWCDQGQKALLKAAFERAGFKNVILENEGTGTMVWALR
jgi:hypothetical protein